MEKYLPIGSVCTLKGKNKKVMITGFYSVVFNGNLKITDYSGCTYPEGLLLPELTCNFNHSDIEEVNFIGYLNDDQKKFNNMLKRLTNDETKEYTKDDWILSSGNSYSKILFDENGVVVLAEPIVEEKKLNNNIKFDENGVVIADDSAKVNNPFYKSYEDVVSLPINNENNIFSNVEFDENGVVVSTETFDSQKKESLNKIEFDENGVVISTGVSTRPEEVETNYEFDENGTVVAIGERQEDISPIGPGLSENVESKEVNYKFDENGTVVSE